MLDDKDRIFKNLYGLHDWGLEGARRRLENLSRAVADAQRALDLATQRYDRSPVDRVQGEGLAQVPHLKHRSHQGTHLRAAATSRCV